MTFPLEKVFLGFCITSFAFAIVGVVALFSIFNAYTDCEYTNGTLVNITRFDESRIILIADGENSGNYEYTTEVYLVENGTVNNYPLNQNLSDEFVNKYENNKTYIVAKCDGKLRELINDDWFNRWITS